MYIKAINGNIIKYPYTIDELFKDNPDTSFPSSISSTLLEEFNVYSVVPSEKPYFTSIQFVEEVSPTFLNGSWIQSWIVKDCTPEQIEEKKKQFFQMATDETKNLLNKFAREKQYDDIQSLCSYVDDPNLVFSSEATYGIQKRSSVWISLFDIFDKIKNNEMDLPKDFSEIFSLLPSLTWPENL